jgi:hypothetical protein
MCNPYLSVISYQLSDVACRPSEAFGVGSEEQVESTLKTDD